MKHPAKNRYFPDETWSQSVIAYVDGGLIRLKGKSLELTKDGLALIHKDALLKVGIPRQLPFEIKVGPIASGNVVVKDGVTWENLAQSGVQSVVGLDMEAAAIGRLSHLFKISEWVVVKGVMDHADPRKEDRYKAFAARASAEVLFAFLASQLAMVGGGSRNSGDDSLSRPQGASVNRESLEQAVRTKAETEFKAFMRATQNSPIPKDVRDQLESNMDQDHGPFAVLSSSLGIRVETLLMPLVKERIRLEAELRKDYKIPFDPQRIEEIKRQLQELVMVEWRHGILAGHRDALDHLVRKTGRVYDYKERELNTQRDILLSEIPSTLLGMIDDLLQGALAESVLRASD